MKCAAIETACFSKTEHSLSLTVHKTCLEKMQLNLKRVDYCQFESVGPNSVEVLPGFTKNSQQKAVTGDVKGNLQLLYVKKGELVTEFKYNLAKPINAVRTHGNEGTEIIYIATGTTVRGFSRKGKPTFSLETNLVEPILFLEVTENEDFIVGSAHVYCHYKNGKEVNYFMSPEKINAVSVLPLSKVPILTPLLACSDKAIYSLRDSAVRHVLRLPGVPTVLKLFCNEGGDSGELVVFSTACGILGLARFSRAGPSLLWVVNHKGPLTAGVTCIDFTTIGNSEAPDKMVVGRDDGNLEIYQISVEEEESHILPKLIYSYNCNDSVGVVRGGFFSKNEVEEILVATSHGWIFVLTTDTNLSDLSDPVTAARQPKTGSQRIAHQKILELKNEVEKLQEKVMTLRKKHQNENLTFGGSTQINITHKIVLIADEMVYLLSLESPVSIDYCLLYCDHTVQFIDVERNSAIVSISKSQHGTSATYRCQFNTTRLDIKLRCTEGSQVTNLQIYTVPNLQPKFGVSKLLVIPPLCLYTRIHPENFDYSGHKLTIKGDFSLATVHSWIAACFPEVPERLPLEDEGKLFYEHCFLKHVVYCEYRKSEAIFVTENPSPMNLIREFIAKEAIKANLVLNISAEINPVALKILLEKSIPVIRNLFDVEHQVCMLKGLKEVLLDQTAMNRGNEWMTKEFQEILDKEEGLQKLELKNKEQLEYYKSFMKDLLVTYHGFHGNINITGKISLLENLLENGTVEDLLNLYSAI